MEKDSEKIFEVSNEIIIWNQNDNCSHSYCHNGNKNLVSPAPMTIKAMITILTDNPIVNNLIHDRNYVRNRTSSMPFTSKKPVKVNPGCAQLQKEN